MCGDERLPVPDRHLGVLLHLLAHAGEVVGKDALVDAAWPDVAVTDNSLEQAISALRRVLADGAGAASLIQTVPRQGYRFTGPVSRSAARATDEALDALLAPHRAWVEGRAALETLERHNVLRARRAFEEALRASPEQASAHVGLANACIMQFEMTRADPEPDRAALGRAVRHAREACRLDPDSGEAWATLGFVLDRAGDRTDAAAASRRAVTIEPSNWRHHFRLAVVGWGEERLRAAHRTLALLPGFALAHWLAATVYVARQAIDLADRELAAGCTAQQENEDAGRFSGVALHWLRGVVWLARGDRRAALQAFERELAAEAKGHLYARECAANTWYAIGALRLHHAQRAEARTAFEQALERVPAHPMARAALGWVSRHASDGVGRRTLPPPHACGDGSRADAFDAAAPFDVVMAQAVRLTLDSAAPAAVTIVDRALATAPPGSAGWILPIEPLIQAHASAATWRPVLARLRARAA